MKLAGVFPVFIGAGIGGVLRYVLGGWMAEIVGVPSPWHTMVINICGAFLLGVLMTLSGERGLVSPELRLLLGVGVLGGFTTFSTLSYDTVAFFEQGLIARGATNMLGSAALGTMAAAAGLFVGRSI